MANRKIKIYGHNHAANSAATVTIGGVEVFNGTLTAGVSADADVIDETTNPEPVALFEFTHNNADDSQMTEHALAIDVSAGEIRVGQIWIQATATADIYNALSDEDKDDKGIDAIAIDGDHYYAPGRGRPYGGWADEDFSERKNILINSSAPVIVGDGSDDTIHDGRLFVLGAGDAFTCTARVPALTS